MRNHISLMILIGAISAFANSCADTGEGKTPDCNEGASICTSTMSIKECKGGVWEETQCPASNICNLNTNKCEPSTSTTIPGQDPQNPTGPTTQICTENAIECLDDHNARKCQGGQWANIPCASNEICQNGVCSESIEPVPSDECTDDETECVDDHNAKKCEDGRWVDVPCEENEICQNGACSEVSETECTDDETKCVDDHNAKKCEDGRWVDVPCESNEICQDGVCSKASETECEADEIACIDDHNAKKCDKGKWVKVACKSNETCQSGSCTPNSTPTECTENATECADDDHVKKCVKGNWETTECKANEICKDNACSAVTVQLEEVLKTGTLADVGKKCSLDDFTDACENNQMIYCTSKGLITSTDICDILSESNDMNVECHVINGVAGCVYPDEDNKPETCDAESITVHCHSDGITASYSGCGKAEDGNLYVLGEYTETCVMECKDGVGCTEIPEAERCDVATYIETCDKNSIVSCVNGRLTKTDCGKQTCHAFATKGVAKCTDNTTCSEEGPSIACDFQYNSSGEDLDAFADSYMCAKAEDNKRYLYQTNREKCSYDCVSDIGCVNHIKGEGDECYENSYEEQCRTASGHSVAMFCHDGTVEAFYCTNGKKCLNEMTAPNYVTGCYDDSSLCNKGDASYDKCTESNGNYASTVTYECVLMSDDSYHYTPNMDTLKSCASKACNSAGTACK